MKKMFLSLLLCVPFVASADSWDNDVTSYDWQNDFEYDSSYDSENERGRRGGRRDRDRGRRGGWDRDRGRGGWDRGGRHGRVSASCIAVYRTRGGGFGRHTRRFIGHARGRRLRHARMRACDRALMKCRRFANYSGRFGRCRVLRRGFGGLGLGLGL